MVTSKGIRWMLVLFGLSLATAVVAKAAGDPTGLSGMGAAAAKAAQSEAETATAKKIQSVTDAATDKMGVAAGAVESEMKHAQDTADVTDAKVKKKAENLKKGGTRQITGHVTAIDTATNSLTLQKGKKEPVVIHLTKETQIKAGKTLKSLSDLKVGDKVKMKIREEGGQVVARVIHLKW